MIVMIKSAGLIRHSFLLISSQLRINPFVSGFIILSIASSLPEISVAINSSAQDVPDLSVGNLFGATIFLLTFVFGSLAVKQRGLRFEGAFQRKDIVFALLIVITMALVIFDGNLMFIEGVFLMMLYLSFVIYLVRKTRKSEDEEHKLEITTRKALKLIIKAITGIILLIISSNLLIDLSVALAIELQISETLIGLVLLGIGTNLPEFTIMFTSRNGNESRLAAGNVVGSAVTNVPILGLLGILIPHNIDDITTLIPIALTLIFACLSLSYFAWTDKKITFKEGLLLMSIFVILLILQILKIF